jgi:hypothetical protein
MIDYLTIGVSITEMMIGKTPLWVSRQHGHSVMTTFRTYTAWMDGATESDVATIQSAMNSDPPLIGRALKNRGQKPRQ